MSIARNHKLKKLAEKQSVSHDDAIAEDATQYELMLAQLVTHQRQLSQIQSIERRVEVKAGLLPDYAAYVDGIIAGNAGAQDDVLMTVMMWRIDVGELAGAIEIADYAIEHELAMPERFKRDTATLIAEETAEYAIAHVDQALEGQSGKVANEEGPSGKTANEQAQHEQVKPDNETTEHLLHVLELTADKDMPDEVRAKLHKALGLQLQHSNKQEAVSHLHRALELNPRSGVKKLFDKLKKDVEQTVNT